MYIHKNKCLFSFHITLIWSQLRFLSPTNQLRDLTGMVLITILAPYCILREHLMTKQTTPSVKVKKKKTLLNSSQIRENIYFVVTLNKTQS